MGIVPSNTDIHGYRPSDLKAQRVIGENTLFAVQANGKNVEQISYGRLSADILLSALKLMNTGSMAFAETWEFSKMSHDHANYTDTRVTVRYGDGSDTVKIGSLSVGDILVEGFNSGRYKTMDIYCPQIAIDSRYPDEPAYGTLRFAYSYEGKTIDDNYISSQDFDGWVFPNGQTYNIVPSQFTKEGNRFVKRDSNPFIVGSTLQTPNLSEKFFRLNPAKETAEGFCELKLCSEHVAIPSHTHDFKLSVGLSLSADIESSNFWSAPKATKYDQNYVHNGKEKSSSSTWVKKYTCSVDIGNAEMSLSTGSPQYAVPSDVKTYPSHWEMPVMIYVGGRKTAKRIDFE